MPDETLPQRSVIRPLALIGLGAILGITYGYLEAFEILVLGRIPGVLAWNMGNSAHIAWFAPVLYTAVGCIASLPFAAWSALTRRPADVAMVFVFAASGAYLGATVAERVLGTMAITMLALGLGAAVVRLYRAHGHLLHRQRAKVVAALGAGVPLAVGTVFTTGAVREQVAYAQLATAPADAPNVLFLVLDSQRADHLSSYGYSRRTTPHIDSLAAEGVLYEQAFAPSSWTLPSHASFFTGRLPQEHRAGIMQHPYLDDRYPTVAEAFSDVGYATGAFVANLYWCGRQTGLNRGFARYDDFYGSIGDAVARTSFGRIVEDVWRRQFGFVDLPGRKRVDRINGDFLEWTRGLDGRPFMAFLNYFDVHGPLLPPAPFSGRFGGGQVHGWDESEFGALPGNMPVYHPDVIRGMIDRYDESLLALDAGIGELIEDLRSSGQLDRTIIVITSDHGESFGEHGMMFHGHSMYREQIHVPLIVRFPEGLAKGLRVSQPVGTERIASTLLDLAGVERSGIAGEPLPMTVSASSPNPVVGGVGRRAISTANWPAARGWVSSVVSDSYHFILEEDGTALVFALSDVDEEQNLAGSPDLADSLKAWIGRYRDQWSDPNGKR